MFLIFFMNAEINNKSHILPLLFSSTDFDRIFTWNHTPPLSITILEAQT